MIEVIPLTREIGAEVRRLDLREEIDPATASQLYAAWLDHLVLVFRDQSITSDDQTERWVARPMWLVSAVDGRRLPRVSIAATGVVQI